MHEDPKESALKRLLALLTLVLAYASGTNAAFTSVVLVAAFFFCSQRMCKVFELRVAHNMT